jgi:hypothetical protein
MQLGMTLAELGRKVGVVNQQVHRHEKWGHRLYPLQILKYAAALDVPVPYFFEGAPSKTAGLVRRGDARYAGTAAKESVFDRPETRRLLEVFSTILEPKQRRMIVQIVKRMATAEPKSTRSVKGSATIGVAREAADPSDVCQRSRLRLGRGVARTRRSRSS